MLDGPLCCARYANTSFSSNRRCTRDCWCWLRVTQLQPPFFLEVITTMMSSDKHESADFDLGRQESVDVDVHSAPKIATDVGATDVLLVPKIRIR